MRKSLSIYIHIPFCVKKCTYCDFLSFGADDNTIGHSGSVRRTYIKCLCKELLSYKSISKDYIVNTIFIGGGTPSILLPGEILTIMTTVRSIFKVAEDAEVTIEVNPGTLTSTKAAEYIEAGINRMSIGLQSANDEELAMLGRIHNFDQFLASYQTARQAGFHNINIDIMSALPGQTLHSYLDTVEKVLKCHPEHISSYSLIVEEGTPLAADQALLSMLPDEAADREMYEATRKLLLMSGYKRYEISNYAKSGYECRHNKVYWTLGEYIGVGLGASSFLNSRRFSNTRDLTRYTNLYRQIEAENNLENIHLAELFANIRYIDEEVNVERRMEEFMICGLRMMDGVSAATFF
jgi:oxygen-independent coproporphyrinogen-3 oxidase